MVLSSNLKRHTEIVDIRQIPTHIALNNSRRMRVDHNKGSGILCSVPRPASVSAPVVFHEIPKAYLLHEHCGRFALRSTSTDETRVPCPAYPILVRRRRHPRNSLFDPW
jgi:hypothetical protein